jgi:hypothetical protein
LEATTLQLRHLQHAARVVRPDVIVSSPLNYGPAIAAELLGVPLVVIGGLTFLWSPGMWRHDDGWNHYRASRAALGLRSAVEEPDGFPPWLGQRFLLQSTPSLSGPLEWDRFDWIGDAIWDPPNAADPALDAWIDGARGRARKIIYVQAGREFGKQPLLEHLEAASQRLDVAFAVSSGRSDREATTTSERVWARPFVPRATVLPHAALVIGSGQPTTVLGALRHELPCVLFFSGSGTEEAALACSHRGLAHVAALEDATQDSFVEIVARALADRAIYRAASSLAAELRLAGGLEAAADIALAHGRVVPRTMALAR